MSSHLEREYLTTFDEEGVKNLLDLIDSLHDDGEYRVNLPEKSYDQIFYLNQ